ncbi:hypothetical protein GWI33_006455 [Rhynchophorus ferrugineus]|uniref:RIIa domain-containing protein n=1 Tax=Rhynchophorus ferrugineus TaxID=354439 RepID=A0A834MFF1_RHYFE|nr:hypothetical protein GWI33_006455 [Rhynchophorus ferrugineus]
MANEKQSNNEELKTSTEYQTAPKLSPNPQISEEFRNLLLEFVISCLLAQPESVIDYAADFFNDILEKRQTTIVREYEEEGEGSVNESNDSEAELDSKNDESGHVIKTNIKFA